MYVLTEALRDLGRNKGCYIPIAIIMFVTIATATTAITIGNIVRKMVDDYKVSHYDALIGHANTLKHITNICVIDVIILGTAIVAFLVSLAMCKRKYEISLLRAMGMKKKCIARGLWLEMFIMTFISSAIGIIVGSKVSQHILDALIYNQTDMRISWDAATWVEIILIALLLMNISGFISMAKMTKYEPTKILMPRD
jgi:putative ABC transport system permease protein